jgi:hypothetical protein
MNESEQYRLTRWGIPGWTAILSAFLFAIIDLALTSPNATLPLFDSIIDLMKSVSTMSAAIAALFVAVAGVPLGFCIYQAYFWMRWNSPFSRDGFLPPLIVGREDDLDRTLRDLSKEQIALSESWRENWVNHPLYKMDHGWRWRYMENLFIEISQKIDNKISGISVYARHRSLLDLMHTLGASLAGIYLGFLVYLLAKVKLQSAPFTINLLITAIPLAVLIILLDLEDRGKKAHESAKEKKPHIMGDHPANVIFCRQVGRILFSIRVSHPSIIFLFLLASFLYLGSPSPYITVFKNPIPLRILVLIIPAFAWYFGKFKMPRDIRVTEFVLLLSSILIAFYWSAFAFLLANLVFLKNRQNTRDDLIALEYYTLRRFLN